MAGVCDDARFISSPANQGVVVGAIETSYSSAILPTCSGASRCRSALVFWNAMYFFIGICDTDSLHCPLRSALIRNNQVMVQINGCCWIGSTLPICYL